MSAPIGLQSPPGPPPPGSFNFDVLETTDAKIETNITPIGGEKSESLRIITRSTGIVDFMTDASPDSVLPFETLSFSAGDDITSDANSFTVVTGGIYNIYLKCPEDWHCDDNATLLSRMDSPH